MRVIGLLLEEIRDTFILSCLNLVKSEVVERRIRFGYRKRWPRGDVDRWFTVSCRDSTC